ncbi:MAG: beta-N-acetylhexosaminidase [Deltaproteobacteria bacterium]|nr:beta-N-acetylhexosaminidase [Deltaproteobacteria bacterium]
MKEMAQALKLLICIMIGFTPIYAKNYEKQAQELLEKMTVKEKIGQIFMIGFVGKGILSTHREFLKKYPFSNFILFSYNIENDKQLKTLIDQIREQSSLPTFITTDQEGGDIVRIREEKYRIPSAMAMGVAEKKELVERAAYYLGYHMRSLGFNLNLAPVLDINEKKLDNVMGNRSFGSTAQTVGRLGRSYIKGLQKAGLSAAAKHFPGHGNALGDSHKGISRIPYSFDKVKQFDVIPFQDAIKQEVDVIMTAHITLKDDTLPVSLSEKYLNQYLRTELGFEGIILSDDMEMNAVLKEFGLQNAIIQSFLAGTDMMMVAGKKKNQKAAFNAIVHALNKGVISEERLNQSVRRILQIKLQRAAQSDSERAPSSDFRQSIAQKAVTVLQTSQTFADFSKNQQKRLLVITPYYSVYKTIAKKYPSAQFLYLKDVVNQKTRPLIIQKIIDMKNQFDYALVAFKDSAHVQLINDLAQKKIKPVFALSLSTPFFKVPLKEVASYVCIYDYHVEAVEAYLSYLSAEKFYVP